MRMLARKPVANYRLDFSSSNVLTSGWTIVRTNVEQPASAVEIFNGSGSTLIISKGTAGNETTGGNLLPYFILPGGSSILLPWELAKGASITLKAVDADVTTGSFIINLFG